MWDLLNPEKCEERSNATMPEKVRGALEALPGPLGSRPFLRGVEDPR